MIVLVITKNYIPVASSEFLGGKFRKNENIRENFRRQKFLANTFTNTNFFWRAFAESTKSEKLVLH
jgi:hypothetical protein